VRLAPASAAAPVAGAGAAALLAPLLLGSPPGAALSAAAFVALTALAAVLARVQDRAGRRLLALPALGLLLLGVASAAPILPDAVPAALSPLLGLSGAALLAGSVHRGIAWAERQELMLEVLRTRLSRREEDVRAQAQRIRRLDQRDPPTGLLNRRGLLATLERTLLECAQEQEPLVVLAVELPAGLLGTAEAAGTDPVARRIARAAQQAVRGSDAAGRWGEHRLVLLLARCRVAQPAIARLRDALVGIPGLPEQARVAGVAIGAAGPWPEPEEVVAAAEAALESAKAGGPVSAVVLPVEWSLEAARTA
jgi:GGDEF domain-containing protein